MANVLRNGVIRSRDRDQVQPPMFTFSDLAARGDDYVQDVRARATEVVKKAKEEADSIRRKAEREGVAAAEVAMEGELGERLGKELETLRPALDGVVQQLQAARGEWQEHWRASAITLATAIAEKILRRELAQDPTISEAWLTEALEIVAGSSEITIRLAPDDVGHLREHTQKLAESMGGIGEARFVADETISPGGCRVETRHGMVDQQLESQLDRLKEELS